MADIALVEMAAHRELAGIAGLAIHADKQAMAAKTSLIEKLGQLKDNLREWLENHPRALAGIKAHWEKRIAAVDKLMKAEKRTLKRLQDEALIDFLALQMSQMPPSRATPRVR